MQETAFEFHYFYRNISNLIQADKASTVSALRPVICIFVSEEMVPIQIDLFGKGRSHYLSDLDLDELMFESEAFHQRTPDSVIC